MHNFKRNKIESERKIISIEVTVAKYTWQIMLLNQRNNNYKSS